MLSVECSETEQEVKEQVLALFVWTPFTLSNFVSEALHNIHVQSGNVMCHTLGSVNNRQIEMNVDITWPAGILSEGYAAQVKVDSLLRSHGIVVVRWIKLNGTQASLTLNARALSKD